MADSQNLHNEVLEQVQSWSDEDVQLLIKDLIKLIEERNSTWNEDVPWSDQELDELIKPKPMTGAEIVAAGLGGAWEYKEITDSVEWLKQHRQRRWDKRKW